MQDILQKLATYFDFLQFLDATGRSILGNPPSHWVMATILATVVMFLLKIAYRLIMARLQVLAARTDNRVDDVIADTVAKTKSWLFVVVGIYAGLQLLDVGSWGKTLSHILVVACFYQAGIWVSALLTSGLKQWHEIRNNDASLATAMVAFRFVGRFLIWAVVLLLILDNLGVKVVSLLAGLGVGGIAIALAVQRVLGDLLASVSIVLDKPFEIGDNITVGDMVGTVEHVGLKTTRLRAASGEQLIVSNSDLLNSRIRNFKRMKERRNVFTFGLAYQTSPESLAKVPEWVRDIVATQNCLRFDRAHLQKLADSSILFEVVYWVTTPDYAAFMDAQQAVNLALLQKLNAEGVSFAYPTQTVFVNHSAK